jgi:hypothetical protein
VFKNGPSKVIGQLQDIKLNKKLPVGKSENTFVIGLKGQNLIMFMFYFKIGLH